MRTRKSNPRFFSAKAAPNRRSQRLTGKREPTPTIQSRPTGEKAAIRKRSNSIPLRTIESCRGTKRLREQRTVSIAEKLLQIWLRGQHALKLPNHAFISFLSPVKSLRTDPTATVRVAQTAQDAAKF